MWVKLKKMQTSCMCVCVCANIKNAAVSMVLFAVDEPVYWYGSLFYASLISTSSSICIVHMVLQLKGKVRRWDHMHMIEGYIPNSPVAKWDPSGTLQSERAQSFFIVWATLPTSSSVCLVFFPHSLCLARWFWPNLMNRRHDLTTAVCISLRWSGLHVAWLPAGSWHRLPCW